MHRWQACSVIAEHKVIGIIRTEDAAAAIRAARAVVAGGVTVLEVSLTTPGGLDAISALRDDDILLGAGTVLDAASARLACLAGAQFLVSPAVVREVIEIGHLYGVPVLPGAGTATEIVEALRAGADMVKLFPASEVGRGFTRSVLAAIPQAPLVPTGGIDAGNAAEWLASGAVALGVGGSLTQGSESEMTASAVRLRAAVSG